MNWNLAELSDIVQYRVTKNNSPIHSILYENDPFHGSPTEVFAYLGIPESNEEAMPAMVCVHGGGGMAFKEWVEAWVNRGYVAIAMDLSGRDDKGERLPNGGPEQDHDAKFDLNLAWEDLWTYHAVSAVIRANSLLRHLPSVKVDRVGVTGISWGGYVTCIAAGVDPRFSCAIPVYGCGHLQHNSADDWLKIFGEMTLSERQRWHESCDPSVYLDKANMPMLFVSGTNDFAYPLDSLEMSCALAHDVTRCVKLEMGHSHQHGWANHEIAIFADQNMKNGTPLPQLELPIMKNEWITSKSSGPNPATKGHLLYTKDHGKWQDRKWHQCPAVVNKIEIEAKLPKGVSAYFLAMEDERGAYVSSPCVYS